MTTFLNRIALVLVCASAIVSLAQKSKPTPAANAAVQPLKLSVDATHAPEKILHAVMQIPVEPGPVTLLYPKWIPGEHGPTGPIADLTGLQFFASGQKLVWNRDLSEMFTFHLTVPARTNTIEARFDLVMPAPPEGFSSGASATEQLDLLSWNQVVLYPPGRHTDDIPVLASLRLPGGWHYDTALTVDSDKDGLITFRQVALTTLVDSPVLA